MWIVPALFVMIAAVQKPASADEISYDPHGKRDPFVPLITLTSKDSTGLMGVETVDELTIEGLVYDPKSGSIVVINGSVLKEGDEISGVKVLKIKPDGATLSLNGAETFKPMYQDDPRGSNQ